MARLLPHLLRAGRRGAATLTVVSVALTTGPMRAQTVDGAAEARAIAPGLMPEPDALLELEDGTVTLHGGGEIPLEELFPGGGHDTDLADAYGDEAATIDLGHAAQQRLLTAPTAEGEAYRTLLDSPYDGPRDLSAEPWFDGTRTILGDIERLGAAFGSCVPVQTIGSNPRTVFLPDPRICTRPADTATSGACRIEHGLTITEESALARVGVHGQELNTFHLDFAHGSWRSIAPSDGTAFAGEVPRLDVPALCDGTGEVSFELAALGTWADAPVPGDLDDSIAVATLQAPSCENGLVGVVQLVDRGGDEKNRSGAELGLTILRIDDVWFPRSCLDLAAGLALPPGCTIAATTIDPPDADGCAIHDSRRICEGDTIWRAIAPPPFDPGETRIGRLAGGADIAWTCPVGAQPTAVEDSCARLRERPECRLQSSTCIAGQAETQSSCTAVEDSYDCGREVVIDDGAVRTELQCDGEVACIGDTCTGGENETNPSFAEVAATLKGAGLAALDGACDPATGACALFTGGAASCKRVLAGTVDCCQDVPGVGIADYLQLAFTIAAIDGAMATLDPTNPLRGGWEVIGSPVTASWDWIGGQFTSMLNGVTGSTTPAASSQAAMGVLGAARQQLMRQTAQWTLDIFGPAAANALFTVNGGAAVAADGTLIAGTTQLGGAAAVAGTALSWIATAYATYQAALILAQIVWACEEQELELAVRRELRQCTSLGSYCATDSVAGCIESRRSFCCYASPISRILQEQIRPQLGLDFGDAENPDCAGLAFSALENVDWSKVDLEEWIAILADSGQLPDAAGITQERLTGHLRTIDAAAAAGGEARRPDVALRTVARTDRVDIPGALAAARNELMPYLRPGAGAPKPRSERAGLGRVPPDLLQPWRLPNRWQEQTPRDPGGSPPSGSAGAPNSICAGTPGRTIQATTSGELKAALAQAQCGDAIVAQGAFSGSFTLAKACGQASPIVLRSDGGARFTNAAITLAGSYGIVTGLGLTGSRVVIRGDHNRVAGNVFQHGSQIAVQIVGGGSNNRIDHNEITGLGSYGIQIKLSTGDPRIAYGNLIDGNHIHDFAQVRNNGAEAIQIGQGIFSASWDTGTVIRDNLISKVSIDSEIISVKSAGAAIVGNTLLDSQAALSLRFGQDNLVEGNYVSGLAGGIKVHGDRHRIIGNVVHGLINIMGGDATLDTMDRVKDATGKGAHPAARGTLVSGNQASTIRVGYTFDTYNTGYRATHPASDSLLVGNQADIQLLLENGTRRSDGALRIEGVRKLAPTDVGPAALAGGTGCGSAVQEATAASLTMAPSSP